MIIHRHPFIRAGCIKPVTGSIVDPPPSDARFFCCLPHTSRGLFYQFLLVFLISNGHSCSVSVTLLFFAASFFSQQNNTSEANSKIPPNLTSLNQRIFVVACESAARHSVGYVGFRQQSVSRHSKFDALCYPGIGFDPMEGFPQGVFWGRGASPPPGGGGLPSQQPQGPPLLATMKDFFCRQPCSTNSHFGRRGLEREGRPWLHAPEARLERGPRAPVPCGAAPRVLQGPRWTLHSSKHPCFVFIKIFNTHMFDLFTLLIIFGDGEGTEFFSTEF